MFYNMRKVKIQNKLRLSTIPRDIIRTYENEG